MRFLILALLVLGGCADGNMRDSPSGGGGERRELSDTPWGLRSGGLDSELSATERAGSLDATPTPPLVPDVPGTTAPAEAEATSEPLSPAPSAAPGGVPTGQGGDTASASGTLVSGDVVGIIHEVFGLNAGAALAVAWCESRFDPGTVGAAGERGLFQIHPVHWSWQSPDLLFDPLYNAQMAYELSSGGTNWSSWSCQP